MLKIMMADRKYFLVEEVLPERNEAPITWYNPLYQLITNTRTVRLLRESTTREGLESYLCKKGLRIYTLADNVPHLTHWDEQRVEEGIVSLQALQNYQRMRDGNDYYVDEFGLYVYVSHHLGYQADRDLRYDGEPDGELFPCVRIQHTCSTTSLCV